MRLEAVAAPDLLHCADRKAGGCRHRPAGPVRRLARRLDQRPLDQRRHGLLRHRRLARLARSVTQQPVDAGLHEALLPAPDAGLRHPGPAHDLGRAATVDRSQDDLSPPHMLLCTVAVRHHCRQPLSVRGAYLTADPLAHLRNVALEQQKGNLLFRSDH